ncbi:hypothetical protein PCE1_004530 [Barthelona sp. PCE]
MWAFISRFPKVIVILWILLAAASIPFALKFPNECSFDLKAPETTRGFKSKNLRDSLFPNSADMSPGVLLVQTNGSDVRTDAHVESLIREFNTTLHNLVNATFFSIFNFDDPDVRSLLNYMVSDDNTTIINLITTEITEPSKKAAFASTISDYIDHLKLNESVVFADMLSFDTLVDTSKKQIALDLSNMDKIAIPLAFIILVLMLRSIKLLIVPLVSLSVTFLISFAVMYFIAKFWAGKVLIFVPSIIMSIIVALGIDYSLFMLVRFRKEIGRGKTHVEATRIASKASTELIFTSATCLLLSFAGLLLFPTSTIRSLAVGCISAIIAIMLVNVTLAPSLLLTFPWFSSTLKRKDALEAAEEEPKSVFLWLGNLLSNKWVAISVVVVAIGVSSLFVGPLLHLDYTTDNHQFFPSTSLNQQSLDLLSREFSAGIVNPYYFVFHNVSGSPDKSSFSPSDGIVFSQEFFDKQAHFANMLIAKNATYLTSMNVEGEAYISGQEMDFDFANLFTHVPIQTPSAVVYRAVFSQVTNKDMTGTVLLAQPNVDPFGEIQNVLPSTMRSVVDEFNNKSTDIKVVVDGTAIRQFDLVNTVMDMFSYQIVITAAVIAVWSIIMTRLPWLPVRMIALMIIPIGSAFGIGAAIFQNQIFGNTGSDSLLWAAEVIAFSICVGLSTDYTFFLFLGVKEKRFEGYSHTNSIKLAMHDNIPTILGAGFIMITSFLSLAVSDLVVVKSIGIILASSVFIDVLFVRTLIAPAVLYLSGDSIVWWPRKPDEAQKLSVNERTPLII